MTSQIFTKSRAIAGPGQAEIHVAAFGKHPAWNDFIDDPGLETERLIALKRVLFLEGIGNAIETGSWDKLETAQRTDGFAHLILWRSRGEIMACRLWSSSDGKGRTKYPMVVVAHCKGVGLAWVLAEALPRLERLERRCREATTQEQVHAALEATRVELRARAAVAEPGAAIESTAVGEVAHSLSSGSDREAFYRLMYQVERDWAPYLLRRGDSGASTKTWVNTVRPQQVRVPSLVRGLAENASRWMHFVLSLVDSATSVTLVRSTDATASPDGWTDLIVGEPEGAQFFCMRASEESLPLATSIPYTIEPTFKEKCDRLVEDSVAGRLGGEAAPEVAASHAGLMQRVKGLLGGKKRGLLVLLVAAGLVGTGVGIAVFFSGSGGGGGSGAREVRGTETGDSKESPRADAPREHPPPVEPVLIVPAAEAGEWGRLCAEYHDWFAEFRERLDKKPPARLLRLGNPKSRAEYYERDAYLAALLDGLREAEGAGKGIDPWSIAGLSRSRDLAELAKAPPASIAEAGVKERVGEALRIIDGFSTRLVTDWPVLKELRASAEMLEATGLRGEASFVRVVAGGVDAERPGGLTEGIDTVLAVSVVVEEITARVRVRNECVALVKSSGDPVAARFAAWAEATGGAAGEGTGVDMAGLEDLARRLARVTELAEPLSVFLKEEWAGTDRELLARRLERLPAATSEPTREMFISWLELARISKAVDAGSDPRLTGKAAELLAGAASARQRLEEEFKAAPDGRLVELQASVEGSWEELRALRFDAETAPAIIAGVARIEARVRELKQGLDNAIAVESAKRAGTAKEVREGLAAQETIVTRSVAINASWRAGRDVILAMPDAEYAVMRVRADTLRTVLIGLDGRVGPGVDAGDGEVGGVRQAIAAASWARREALIVGVLGQWPGIEKDADGAGLARLGDAAAASFKDVRSEMDALVQDISQLRASLLEGASLRDKAPSGEPLAAIVERCRRSPLVSDAQIGAQARPLFEEIESLERVEALVGAKELIAAARGALPARWGVALAAWRRLGRLSSPAWPDSLDALQQEASVSAALQGAVSQRAGTRRADLEREIKQQRARRWAVAFESMSDPADIEAGASMAEEMGVDIAALPAAARYNLELAALRRAGGSGVLSDEQARESARRFDREVRLLAGVAELPGVARFLEQLGPIAGVGEQAAPKIDVTRLGPGSAPGALAGFAGVEDGRVLRFTRAGAGGAGGAGSALTLEFLRVESPGIETFFIATTECSLAELTGVVDAGGAWADLATLFMRSTPVDESRKGPCVWRWVEEPGKGKSMRPATRWLQELATGRPIPESPAAMGAGAPTAAHPVNYMPPAAALFVAHMVGCRLPTAQEWQAAAAVTKAGENLRQRNLRDEQWKRQQAYINEVARAGSVRWPDDDVFLPVERAAKIRTGPLATSHPWDDGVLWFAPVGTAGGDIAHHLVGNVAEYVIDASAGELASAPGGASARHAEAVLGRVRSGLRVVGGSSMSPLELDPMQAHPLELMEGSVGFTDVGFRLAFSAVGAGPIQEPLGRRLAKAAAEASYIVRGENEASPK